MPIENGGIYMYNTVLVASPASVPFHLKISLVFELMQYGESIFSSPGRSPGRAILFSPASALALVSASELAKC